MGYMPIDSANVLFKTDSAGHITGISSKKGTTPLNILSTDASGNTIGINTSSGVAPLSPSLPNNTLAILGTSIEALLTSTVAYSGSQSAFHWTANSGIAQANVAMGFPFSTMDSYGVNGDTSGPSTTTQVNPGFTSRISSIIAGKYGWCYVGFPINDVTNAGQYNLPIAWTIANMYQIYSQLLAAGIKVIAATGGPTSQLTATGTVYDVYRNNYAAVQTAIENYATSNAGIILAPTAQAMTNAATGVPFTSPASTIDGTHDNYYGAGLKAQCLVSVLTPLIKAQDTGIENPLDPRNYISSPFMQGNGTVLAGFAMGTGGSCTCTATKLTPGQLVTLSGTIGTGTLTGYVNPTTYLISATNGTTTFTLIDLQYGALTSASPTGLTATTGPYAVGIYRGNAAVAASQVSRTYNKWRQPSQGLRLACTFTATGDNAAATLGYSTQGGFRKYDGIGYSAAVTYMPFSICTPSAGANGYFYEVVNATGLTSGTEPIWTTQEGAIFTDQNGTTWICKKFPTSGDKYYAEIEVETSGLTANKGANVHLVLHTFDTSGTLQQVTSVGWTDYSPTNIPARFMPPTMRLRTPTLTLGSYALRYLGAYLRITGEAGASVNIDVYKVNITRVT